MCFSAPVSFTASALIGAVGIATLIKVKKGSDIPLALVPLIFAAQQFVEGMLWLNIGKAPGPAMLFTYIFCFFALLWWPLYVPLVALVSEQNEWRRKIIRIFCFGGAVLGAFLYAHFLVNPLSAQVVNKCIYYNFTVPYPVLFTIAYSLLTLVPGIISSSRFLNLFGCLVTVLALVARYAYFVNFVSVWCFFAAILSVLIFFNFRETKHFSPWLRDKPQ